METNWNQLIELYLQNELSEEGRSAFEQELNSNPELREELEMHQLVRSAAKRASQRNLIRQTGQSYLRNLRIKQFTAALVVTGIAVAGIIYWKQNQKETNTGQLEKAELRSENNSDELLCRAYQINHQSNQPGGKSSLIQPTDWQTKGENDKASQINAHFITTQTHYADNSQVNRRDPFVKSQVNTATRTDSVQLPKPTVTILGYNDKLEGKVVEIQKIDAALSKNYTWIQKYDSVGKFNDLYCGYALVMDKSKFGFVDPDGKIFIPIIYDQLVVTTNIKSSKQKNKRQKKKVLYIPKRSGKDVKDCEEDARKGSSEPAPRFEEVERKLK